VAAGNASEADYARLSVFDFYGVSGAAFNARVTFFTFFAYGGYY